MIGVTRGISTLAGAAVAGILLWFATQVGTETSGDYWATYGLIASAGLTMALSQILGGWTKWGWPRFSAGVFLLAFLPALLAGGWVLLARQPADWFNTSNWSRDIGVDGAVAALGNILPAVAFGVGLIFGLSFDTAGPRRESAELTRTSAADDAPAANQGPYADPPTVPVGEPGADHARERATTSPGESRSQD